MPTPFDLRAFVASLPGFSGWTAPPLAPALDQLVQRAEVWSYAEGDVVRFPDEGPAGPTWVAEGCLVVLYDGASPRYIGVREPLDVPAGPWVRGKTTGRFVTVPEDSWKEWLRQFPHAAEKLGLEAPPELPRAFRKSPLVLEPGEVPVHVFRKSRVFLVQRATLPGFFFLLFLAFGVLLQTGLGDRVPALALWLLPVAGMMVTAALIALVAWEWSTSMLAVTNRSVIVRQIDVWTHRSDFEKLALDRIREAVYTKSGWMDALLHLVALEVEGDSPKGRLVFRGLARDSRFLGAMEDLRAQRRTASPTRRIIRQALADRTGGARAPRLERGPRRAPRPAPHRRRLSWRTEKSGGVWFRRHPWILFKRSLPWAGWAALAVFLGAVAAGYWPAGWMTVGVVAGIAALVPLARIGWDTWDWANDRLSIQGDKVTLVHRKPLWLGEVRQEGTLDKVEQVGVHKESLAALVLDYGTVTINLGGSDPLVFDHASHPEWVQNEIFYRRTLGTQDRERQAVQARLDEVSEILDTWDEAKKAGYFQENKERI
jgi:hypothetical protein